MFSHSPRFFIVLSFISFYLPLSPSIFFYLPLSDCLKHQYGSADADVQRVNLSKHGDADMRIGGLAPLVGQSVVLGAHDDGRAAGHIRVVIQMGILQLSRQDFDATLLQERDAVRGRAGHTGHGERGTYRRANEVGIV